ncbi:MAG TPA: methyltransferase, partial [Candidatus Thermoplasmatota archaeon]|nr:methyltransferase [Candidatus Thermoplasmatota archaeon]
ERLIVAGPFRWVRNPLYVGNLLFAASFGLYLPPPGLLLAVAAMALPLGFVAAAEERALRRRFGPKYEDYAAKVPAFLPRPPRGLPGGDEARPAWGDGLLAEAWQLLAAAYLACLALRQFAPAAAALLLAVAGIGWVRLRGRRAAALRPRMPP